MQYLLNLKNRVVSVKSAMYSIFLMMAAQTNAALPTMAEPSQNANDGDFIGVAKGYMYDIGIVLGLGIATVAFIVVANNMIGVYKEIGAGKKTWGDMGMHGAAGVVLLVFVVYLLTQAADVLAA